MNGKERIDELLKESFEHFTPDAPDVWSNIQAGIGQSAVSSAGAGTKIMAAVKSASIVTKVMLALVIPAAGLITYMAIDQEPAPQVVATVEQKVQASVERTEPTAEQVFHEAEPLKTAKATVSSKEIRTIETAEVQPDQIEEVVEEQPVKAEAKPTLQVAVQEAPVVKPQPKPKTLSVRERMKQGQTIGQQHAPVQTPQEEPAVTIPNVFTPNGDQLNDQFQVSVENASKYHMKVVDQSGKIVFETEVPGVYWDGRYQQSGEACDKGTYVYQLYYIVNGTEYLKRGTIELIR